MTGRFDPHTVEAGHQGLDDSASALLVVAGLYADRAMARATAYPANAVMALAEPPDVWLIIHTDDDPSPLRTTSVDDEVATRCPGVFDHPLGLAPGAGRGPR